jgi:formyl-CoA transferase
MYLAHGLMAALLEREKSGVGQWVQTSLLETMIALLDFQATRWLIAGEVPPQAGNDHPTGFPTGVFPTKDGVINIAATGDRMFRDFCRLVGAEQLTEDERFRTPRARGSHRSELRELVEDRLRQKTSAEWIELFNEAGVPCGPINAIDEVFEDPQVQFLGMAAEVESPVHGKLRMVRSPINLSRTPAAIRRGHPGPGHDTEAVLAEYGYSAAEIAALAAQGAIANSVGAL